MTFEDDLNMILEEAGGHIAYCSDDGADEKLAIIAIFKERCVDKQRVREAIEKCIIHKGIDYISIDKNELLKVLGL